MPRKPPPPGLITAGEAAKILNVSTGMLSIYVKQNKLHREGPASRTYKFYVEAEVRALAETERVFFEAERDQPREDSNTMNILPAHTYYGATFSVATANDMDALYTMAKKLFPKTADADRRRSWLTKEPQGHFVVKSNSGAVLSYLYLLPLVANQLSNYLHDDLPSRAITPDDIEPFAPGKKSESCVIGGIGSDPDLNQEIRTNCTGILLRGVKQELQKLGEQGIIIPKLYAFSETTTGITMCARLGMSQWEEPRGKWCTFQIDLEQTKSPLFQGYKKAIAAWKLRQTTQTQ